LIGDIARKMVTTIQVCHVCAKEKKKMLRERKKLIGVAEKDDSVAIVYQIDLTKDCEDFDLG
jgi:hypothetical protein